MRTIRMTTTDDSDVQRQNLLSAYFKIGRALEKQGKLPDDKKDLPQQLRKKLAALPR